MRSLLKELLFVHRRLYIGRKYEEIISPLMSDFGLNEGLLNKYPKRSCRVAKDRDLPSCKPFY